MKRSYNIDIILVVLLAIISFICISTPDLNKYSAAVIPYLLLLFFLPGYSILIALSTKRGLIRRIVMGIILSSVIVFSYTTFSNQVEIPFETFLLILTGLTLFFAAAGYIRRIRASKKPEYVTCKSCEGYYKLEEGESLDDFEACHCGGELKYAEISKQKSPKRKNDSNNKKSTSKGSKSVNNEYLMCENCGGRYKLGKGESLEDFESCHCGGELKYAKNYFKPKKKSRYKLPKDTLLVIILSLSAVAAVNFPAISNSGLRLILILPLLFFLPGYSITKIIFPRLSLIKLMVSSIVLSAAFTFLLSLAFSCFVKVPQTTCILVLAGFTIILTIISYIKLPKLSKGTKKFPKLPESYTKTLKVKKAEFRLRDNEPVLPDKDSKFELFDKNLRFLPSDIALIWLITALTVIFVITPVLNDTVFRTILGFLLILFAPGYSLIAALFPRKDDLDGIERVALSFGLSIAVTPLIGLLLNYTPFGIRLEPILISLSIFTIAMSAVAYIRRWKLYENERFIVDFKHYFNTALESFNKESGTDRILSIILVISIVLAVSATIFVIASPKEGEKFTEFYILGPNGKASDYPTNLTAGERGNVTVGVVNHEYASVNYKLMVKLNNITIENKNITLSSNEKYEAPSTFTPLRSGDKQKLEFLLYKLPDEDNPYRSLHLWLNVR